MTVSAPFPIVGPDVMVKPTICFGEAGVDTGIGCNKDGELYGGYEDGKWSVSGKNAKRPTLAHRDGTIMTPDEEIKAGLDPTGTYRRSSSGMVEPITGPKSRRQRAGRGDRTAGWSAGAASPGRRS